MRVLFVVFLFLYFYRFQTPLLALVQHRLSEGQTTYTPFISSAVLTFVLFVVQKLVSRWIHFSDTTYFFSYVPSAIFAVLLTAFTPAANTNIFIGVGVALVCFILAVVYTFVNKASEDRSSASFFKVLMVHSLGMIGIFTFIGGLSHSNDSLTYELGMARSLSLQDREGAKCIGAKSLASSKRLCALRAYALSLKEGALPDSMFVYPLSGSGAELLLFEPNDTLAQLLPPDSLYAKFGVWPSSKETAIGYFERMVARTAHPSAKDYWLTALLLEKNLDKFVKELPLYYQVADSVKLPRAFSEALCLYNNETTKPLRFEGDSVSAETFNEFLIKGGEYEDSLVKENELRRIYGDTYWWYYYYQK